MRRVVWVSALLALSPMDGEAAVPIGGPFELVDQDGRIRRDTDFLGSYLLVYFGYTYCADLCPTTLIEMASAIDDLALVSPAKANRVIPVFVSIDPERDTPAVLRRYAQDFHPRLVALTGTPAALANAGRPYGVRFARVPGVEPDRYLLEHTSFVYLMGPDGKYLEHFESDATVADLVDSLQRQVRAPGSGDASG